MREPSPYTAEDAPLSQLRSATLRLFCWLIALVLTGPVIESLPVGQTTRTGLLAWLLLGVALYWLYAGLGFYPLLLLQLMCFSAATTLLVLKAGLVVLGADGFEFLRDAARALLLGGGLLAGANLGMMLAASVTRRGGATASP